MFYSWILEKNVFFPSTYAEIVKALISLSMFCVWHDDILMSLLWLALCGAVWKTEKKSKAVTACGSAKRRDLTDKTENEEKLLF